MENPFEINNLEVPPFQETAIYIYVYIPYIAPIYSLAATRLPELPLDPSLTGLVFEVLGVFLGASGGQSCAARGCLKGKFTS